MNLNKNCNVQEPAKNVVVAKISWSLHKHYFANSKTNLIPYGTKNQIFIVYCHHLAKKLCITNCFRKVLYINVIIIMYLLPTQVVYIVTSKNRKKFCLHRACINCFHFILNLPKVHILCNHILSK